MAVAIAYWSRFRSFTWKLFALKTQSDPFHESASSYPTELASFGVHPTSPLGHFFVIIRGHFSQAIPQTPIFMRHNLGSQYNPSQLQEPVSKTFWRAPVNFAPKPKA